MLRVYAGGVVGGVWISHWIIIMTFLLSLFLAMAKRRDDLIMARVMARQNHGTGLRLDGYNIEFVSHSMVLLAGVTIVSYILYTVSPEVIQKHGTDKLYLTTIWVIFGLLRYLQIAFVEQKSGPPTLLLIKDVVLQVTILLWMGSFYMFSHIHGG